MADRADWLRMSQAEIQAADGIVKINLEGREPIGLSWMDAAQLALALSQASVAAAHDIGADEETVVRIFQEAIEKTVNGNQ